MSQIFCIVNQKGGVGKTTTAINLGACLAWSGFKVLLIDLDPQCNATSGLGFQPLQNHPLITGQPWKQSLITTHIAQLDLLPGTKRMQDVQTFTSANRDQSDHFRQQLSYGLNVYDYVLIDSPPHIGPLTRTALAASTEVLMPIQCEFFAMEGVVGMVELIRQVMNDEQRNLQFGGILLTMVDYNLELTREVETEVRDFFGEVVFRTVIPRDVTLAEASSFGKSILEYAPRSRAARAYRELCMEVTERG